MKSINNNLTTVFNDLAQINSDRANELRVAVISAGDRHQDICGLFERMAEKSEQFFIDLKVELDRLGWEAGSNRNSSGKIYHMWVGTKANKAANSRVELLLKFLAMEEAVQRAYSDALAMEELQPLFSSQQLLVAQKTTLDISRVVLSKYSQRER